MKKKNEDIQIDTGSVSFSRLGGHPILDFINTKVIHSSSIEDRLDHPKKASIFFESVFHVSCPHTPSDFKHTLECRSIFREFFESLILKSKRDSSIINLNRLLSKMSFTPTFKNIATDSVGFQWKPNTKEPAQLLTLVLQFLNFFENADLSRLKKCANPNCSHLFYDISRNNTRNWCSMKSCGNIMKARAFYTRSKKKK